MTKNKLCFTYSADDRRGHGLQIPTLTFRGLFDTHWGLSAPEPEPEDPLFYSKEIDEITPAEALLAFCGLDPNQTEKSLVDSLYGLARDVVIGSHRKIDPAIFEQGLFPDKSFNTLEFLGCGILEEHTVKTDMVDKRFYSKKFSDLSLAEANLVSTSKDFDHLDLEARFWVRNIQCHSIPSRPAGGFLKGCL